MNRTKLKNYAPQARRDFIQAMTDRAAYFGLTDTKSEPVVVKGDVAVIGGRSFPIAVAKKRKALEDRIKRHGPDWSKGFAQTMEAMAYTWFNRLVAIRFMELHGYLDHGYRVLSSAASSTQNANGSEKNSADCPLPSANSAPEVLVHAEHVELPGLKKEAVIDLKLAGNKEGELYRLLLTAQCNALHTAMPFLFEKIDDETELLLPDNLLNSDSLMRKLVGEIEEEDWNEVEIIGWMYQFYISEKKDEVIGKVVASEDIPAATQLFTPNWIVKYLVQNTLGRQWLEHHPESPLKAKMEYYIEPAEQTSEVQAQLQQAIEARTKANRGLTADCPLPSADFSLNPEELTLLDPACGSGHILVEAYDLFKAIYQERGYRAKDIPALILQKNLFGMEIDDRAAQLAAFALMMKARADDRRIFDSEAKPNILAFEDSQGLKASDIYFALTSPLKGEREDALKSPVPDGYLFEPDDNLFTRAEDEKAAASRTPTTVNFSQADIASLLELFENAKTFGSLIQVPPKLAAKLPEIEKRLDDVLKLGDLTHASAHVLKPLLQQARLLARQYDALVANPPYLGSKSFNGTIRTFAANHYPQAKADLFAFFTVRIIDLVRTDGLLGLMTPFTWMFIQSYEHFRTLLAQENAITTLVLPEYHAFFDSAFVPICSFVVKKSAIHEKGTFIDLSQFYGEDIQPLRTLEAIRSSECKWKFIVDSVEFSKIPGGPVAFWASDSVRRVCEKSQQIELIANPMQGSTLGENERFLRYWYEVSQTSIPAKWTPCIKGGKFRKWFGNDLFVVNWANNGSEVKSTGRATIRNENYFFKPGIEWNRIGSSIPAFRAFGDGYVYESASGIAFPEANTLHSVLGFFNSKVSTYLLRCINPTLNVQSGDIARLPFVEVDVRDAVEALCQIAKTDWNLCEISREFVGSPLCLGRSGCDSVKTSFASWASDYKLARERAKRLEEENNRLFIDAYGLHDELSPEVPDDQITLYRPDREEDIKRLLSYAIGCIMGRYSLHKTGLIYAHSSKEGFDASQYKTFKVDDDGIIPLLETDWGIRDDATNRFVEFIGVAWPKEHLEENLKFVADSLGPTGSEQPRDTIRRYLATGFYKHHLSMYKKRPIYWLFSSGKQRAFQCLVYLHRYHEGTLARMRTEYVIPLQGQIAGRIEQLEGDKSKATSTSHRKKLQKEQDDLKKQQTELLTFEEKLKHAADQKISLDLDDGVKVNYAKFGDLLAESKAITGGKDEE